MDLHFSSNLFWDVAQKDIDWNANKNWVIQRVFEYGSLSDVKVLLTRYTADDVRSAVSQSRDIEPRAKRFAEIIVRP